MSSIDLEDPPCRVRLVRNARARRFTLRLEASGGGAVLTVPRGVPEVESRRFLTRHAGWLRSALARQPEAVIVGAGAQLPVAGRPVLVQVRPGPRRAPVLEGGALVLQGAGAEGARIAAWLRLRARDALLPAARGHARRLGRQIEAIALRDTRSRWGSCSSTGTISFSWRLAMAPPEVLDYVAAHEAAHLVEMNHSDRYWAVLERLMPDYPRRRAWLKREGQGLHAYRFD
ncbi:MAG TPA: SprT family zinc-dependent metalloprotease [Paracoccaceae bacterium]|nr:SprT family zinc-dependent metalloprotease [Paracoccaceae bacterium]